MKTTLDLPNELVKEMKLRATQEGIRLEDAVANLLRKGLDAKFVGSVTVVKPSKIMIKRRKEITRKFVSGEWGLELSGFEQGQKAGRQKSKQLANAWRN